MRKYLTLDVLVVLLFVALGRETHDEGSAIADIAATAAPFLIALAAGWAVVKMWHSPLDVRRGVGAAAITVALGMVLRRTVFGDGTAVAFVIVATVFNLGGFAAWRLIAARFVRGEEGAERVA